MILEKESDSNIDRNGLGGRLEGLILEVLMEVKTSGSTVYLLEVSEPFTPNYLTCAIPLPTILPNLRGGQLWNYPHSL